MQLRNSYLALSVLFVVLLASCKSDKPTSSREVTIDEQVPADYLNFYDRFHQDSAFQIEHIVFPLPQMDDGTPWLKDQWILHKAFVNLGNEYLRSFANFEGIINERIIHKSGLFEMNRRFAKISNEWHLIYYTVRQTTQSDWESDTISQ